MEVSVYDVMEVINDLDVNLSSSSVDRKQTIISHLQRVDKFNFRIPEFKQGKLNFVYSV